MDENKIIKYLSENLNPLIKKTGMRNQVSLGIGDDAAIINPQDTSVITTDSISEGVHFSRKWTSWEDLGWKSIAISQSDIASMGAQPMYSVINLCIPNNVSFDNIKDLYKGMTEATTKFGGQIVGGDTILSEKIVISVTMIGSYPKKDIQLTPFASIKPLQRCNANPGDLIGVTGTLGCARGGLISYNKNLSATQHSINHLKNAFNKPIPRIKDGLILSKYGATSAIDISDGLLNDLEKLCSASNVSSSINTTSIPTDQILKTTFPKKFIEIALVGGEDYELLFTVNSNNLKNIQNQCPSAISIIGEISAPSTDIITIDENPIPTHLRKQLWNHFN